MANSHRSSQPPPSEGRILTEDLGRIFLISIDRPHKNNCFTPSMITELADAFTTFELTDQFRCALLYAQGDNFTLGLDLDAIDFTEKLISDDLLDPFGMRGPKRSKPLVAAVQGYCYSLGIELVLASDIVIASGDTRFAHREADKGMMPMFGSTVRLVDRLGWNNAMNYLLTGDEFSAADALRLGLVQEIVSNASTFSYATAFSLLRQQVRQLAETSDFKEGLDSISAEREARFKGV